MGETKYRIPGKLGSEKKFYSKATSDKKPPLVLSHIPQPIVKIEKFFLENFEIILLKVCCKCNVLPFYNKNNNNSYEIDNNNNSYEIDYLSELQCLTLCYFFRLWSLSTNGIRAARFDVCKLIKHFTKRLTNWQTSVEMGKGQLGSPGEIA